MDSFTQRLEGSQRGEVELKVIEIDPQGDPRWAAYVAAHPDALIYHHPQWLRLITEAYGGSPACVACEGADGVLSGVLPLLRTRGLLTGRCLSSLPHTPVAGPLASDDESTTALAEAAIERAAAEPGTHLLLKVPGPLPGGGSQGLYGLPREETYILELPDKPEDLRFGNSRNHARISWATNKAMRSGLSVRPAASLAELREWYGLYLGTMRIHGVPPRPYRFFSAAWELLAPQGLMRLLLAEQHDGGQVRLLAGSVFLMYGKTVFYAFSGRSPIDSELRPNDLIQWQAIHDACRDGFRRYDMGEVGGTQSGLAQFKSKWGAEPRLMYRYHYPEASGFGVRPFEPGARGRKMWLMVWRRLPLGVTAGAGRLIYRYLAG
jgi:CelD/BcsL family acetyltransferase involved in cellulose biosynthesis